MMELVGKGVPMNAPFLMGLFLLSNHQMHGKTASLKSPVSCTEKLDRVQAPLNSR